MVHLFVFNLSTWTDLGDLPFGLAITLVLAVLFGILINLKAKSWKESVKKIVLIVLLAGGSFFSLIFLGTLFGGGWVVLSYYLAPVVGLQLALAFSLLKAAFEFLFRRLRPKKPEALA